MKNLTNGGIETIMVVIILSAVVISLIICAVSPMSDTIKTTAYDGVDKLFSMWS